MVIGADQRRDRAASSAAAGGVRLAELLGRLSLAFDIANDESYGKGVRRAVLAVELGRLDGATDQVREDEHAGDEREGVAGAHADRSSTSTST